MFVRLSIAACVLSLIIGSLLGLRERNRPARLVFLSVGQGDCTAFESQGATVLIDVGPKTREGFDAGDRIVVPRLRAMGFAKVALILLSHPDADHVGGLSAVMRANPSAQIGISDQFRNHDGMLQTLREAGVDPSKVLWFGRRVSAHLGSFQLEIVTPAWSGPANDNDGSMFVRLSSGRSSAVFSGDAPIPVETAVAASTHWTAQLLHAGHHGSRTANGDIWLSQIRPTYAIVSCGRDNTYGHPHRSVLDAFARHGIAVARTDTQGDLVMEATEEGFKLR